MNCHDEPNKTGGKRQQLHLRFGSFVDGLDNRPSWCYTELVKVIATAIFPQGRRRGRLCSLQSPILHREESRTLTPLLPAPSNQWRLSRGVSKRKSNILNIIWEINKLETWMELWLFNDNFTRDGLGHEIQQAALNQFFKGRF